MRINSDWISDLTNQLPNKAKLTNTFSSPGAPEPTNGQLQFSQCNPYISSSITSTKYKCLLTPWEPAAGREHPEQTQAVIQTSLTASLSTNFGSTPAPQCMNFTKCSQRSRYPYSYLTCSYQNHLKNIMHTFLSAMPGHHYTCPAVGWRAITIKWSFYRPVTSGCTTLHTVTVINTLY